jgi:6-phosphogluconolactonase
MGAVLMTTLFPAAALPDTPPAKDGKLWVYVGTYTNKKSQGIYRCELDLATGKLTAPLVAAKTANPSFLAIHPNRRFLYAVGEMDSVGGKKGGAISAFALDPKTGDLTLLNQQSSEGAGPCHLVVDKAGENVLAANYGGGSVCVLPVGRDGRLGSSTSVVQHHGSSVNPKRQKEPHAHSINLDPSNRHAYAADLGLDSVRIYRFDAAKHDLNENTPPEAKVDPGSGPRHFAFHPDGKHAYVINELANTITVFDYNPADGGLTKRQTVPTLPTDFRGESYTAEVQVHPSGKFVYGSNRGHNSIAVFRCDPQTGELTPAGHQDQGINWPRNFGIDPTGQYLLVANERGDRVVVFGIDAESGALKPTGAGAEVPSPVCVKFLPR